MAKSIWDDVKDVEWIMIEEDQPVMIRMLDEDPEATVVKIGRNDVDAFLFRATEITPTGESDARDLTITSMGFMNQLKRLRPIKGKIFEILRTGTGMETKYRVMENSTVDMFDGEEVEE